MTDGIPPISVIVVSFGRARLLGRCLRALHQLRYPRYEVIVVADDDGVAVANTLPFADRLHILPQATANISAARNDGIAVAGGDLLAFIDDDAVPEPTWLNSLAESFAAPTLQAATGPVLGRNGISLQWGRMTVDALGRDHRLDPSQAVPPGQALKLHGTNMAFRREIFDCIGGFDRAFRFYLDDTDLAWRIAQAGAPATFVEGAVVHHGFAASIRRDEDRVPLGLDDIGASTLVFLRKHAPQDSHRDAIGAVEDEQRSRLLRLARRRKLSARRMRLLMESLAAGLEDGAVRPLGDNAIRPAPTAFSPLRDDRVPEMEILFGWSIQGQRLRREAAERVRSGHPVTLFLFEPTPRKHRVRFAEGGWWEQTGGLFGPSDRAGPRLQPWGLRSRVSVERQRVAQLRGVDA